MEDENKEEKNENSFSRKQSFLKQGSIFMNMQKNQKSFRKSETRELGVSPKAQNDVEKWQQEINEIQRRRPKELLDELFRQMCIDNKMMMRKKMKGFTKDTYFIQQNAGDNTSNHIMNAQTAREIRRIIEMRKKEKKEKEMIAKEIEARRKQQNRVKLANDYKQVKSKMAALKANSYKEIKLLRVNYEKDKHTKLTWDELENMRADQFVSNKEDDFDPHALLDDDFSEESFVKETARKRIDKVNQINPNREVKVVSSDIVANRNESFDFSNRADSNKVNLPVIGNNSVATKQTNLAIKKPISKTEASYSPIKNEKGKVAKLEESKAIKISKNEKKSASPDKNNSNQDKKSPKKETKAIKTEVKSNSNKKQHSKTLGAKTPNEGKVLL